MVAQLSGFFMKQGAIVDCFCLPFEQMDEAAMRDFYNGKLWTPAREEFYKNNKSLAQLKSGFERRWLKWRKKWLGQYSKEALEFNTGVDQHLPPEAKNTLKACVGANQYDLVVAEYVWTSSLLNVFPDTTIKVINTHDKFSDRYDVYKQIGKKPEWISLYDTEEARGLRRADLVLALNEAERNYFQQTSGKHAIQYGYTPALRPVPSKKFTFTLLYFASSNELNQESLQWFLKSVWPELKKQQPEIILRIGGKITQLLTNLPYDVINDGCFDDPYEFYAKGDIVINPERSGTGLKIKALEALSFGLPLVATSAGAAGLLDNDESAVLLADNETEFVSRITDLCINEETRAVVSRCALRWLMNYESSVNQALSAALKGLNLNCSFKS